MRIMKNALKALLLILLALAIAAPVTARSLTRDQAFELLDGNSWIPVDAGRRKYWFYHDPEGVFEARFDPPLFGKRMFTGTWFKQDDRLCWDWSSWKTFCYTSFRLDGEVLALTRSDGEVQAGRLARGKVLDLAD